MSKWMVECMLRDVAQATDLRFAALRYFNVAGADPAGRYGQSTTKTTLLVQIAVQTALGLRKGIEIFGTDYPTIDGTCVRDYIHVTDLIDAHVAALKHLRAGGDSVTLNCGYGHGFSVKQVLETVKAVSGRDFDVSIGPRRLGDAVEVVCDARQIREVLDWRPAHDDLSRIVEHSAAVGRIPRRPLPIRKPSVTNKALEGRLPPSRSMLSSAAQPRLASARRGRSIMGLDPKFFPGVVVLAYLVTTLILFFLWPVNWPLYGQGEKARLALYVIVVFVAIYVSYMGGVEGKRPRVTALNASLFIVVGASLDFVLLFPSAFLYTGHWPWQVFESLRDQGRAYADLQAQLVFTSGQRGPLAAARALCAPLLFAALPLGFLNWSRSSWVIRLFVVVAGLSDLTFSILRGTDKEVADIFIVSGSSLMILLARGATSSTSRAVAAGRAKSLVSRYWKPALAMLVFIFAAQSLFTSRKEARMKSVEAVCAVGTGICVDLDAPLIAWMEPRIRFGISEFAVGVSQGYYGVAIAMEKDFRTSWGLGHSPALMALFVQVTGDETLLNNTYTMRNGRDGWSEDHFWSSLITWVANDVGFPGVILVMSVVGFVWGRSWRDAVLRRDDRAAIVFCFLMVVLMYLPANNQMLNNFDGYTTALFWVLAWMIARREARQGSVSARTAV